MQTVNNKFDRIRRWYQKARGGQGSSGKFMYDGGIFLGTTINWRKMATQEAEGESLLFPALAGAARLFEENGDSEPESVNLSRWEEKWILEEEVEILFQARCSEWKKADSASLQTQEVRIMWKNHNVMGRKA